tara:strand:+ start:44 stop:460 length:417 start_codon:yes stop_codon:yes gene_type:complete
MAEFFTNVKTKRVAIVGCRNYKDYYYFKKKLNEWEKENGRIDMVVSGGAKGVDSLATRFAEEELRQLKVFEPDWEKYGIGAGPIRNQKIVDNSDCVIAFPSKDSRGTWNTVIHFYTSFDSFTRNDFYSLQTLGTEGQK